MFGTNVITGKKFFDNAPPESLFVTSMFFTLQGEGPYAGMPAMFIRLTKCNLTCSFCFVPSTKVIMGDGRKKRIDEVKVGDIVMSWSGDKFEPKKVTRTYMSIADKLIKLTTSGEPVWCTPEHPFLTSNRGWVNAEELKEGDILVHWGISAHMKHFNPRVKGSKSFMSKESKEKAAKRLSKLWEDEEFRFKNIERMKNQNPMKDPSIALKSFLNRENNVKSSLEERFEKICDGLPIKFVGNGDLTISYKVPDFVVEGQKKVIEIWSDDSLWVQRKPRDIEWMEHRRKLFAKEGYDVLFLPLTQPELKMSEHIKIREKVSQFINNGKVVKKVEFVNENDGRGWARLFGTKTAERLVYNLEVEDNHTYIANGCVVHNCDTFFDDGDWMTFQEIETRMYHTICDYWNDRGEAVPKWALDGDAWNNFPGVILVMTGGEPLLQENITEFMRRQLPKFKAVQVESNGIPDTEVPEGVTLVCSPKCAEKNGVATRYLEPSRTILNRADCLKFVMSADPDSPYREIPDWALEWKRNNPGKEIYVSPMNVYNTFPQKIKLLRAEKGNITMAERSTVDEKVHFFEPGLLDMEKVAKNHEYVGKYCIENGLRMNMQMHLFANLA